MDDKYELLGADIAWALKNFDFHPKGFLKNFYKNWKGNHKGRFPNNLIDFAKNVLKSNEPLWKKCKNAGEINELSEEEIEIEFKNRLCGFSYEELLGNVEVFRERIKKSLVVVEKMIKKIRARIRSLDKQKDRGKRYKRYYLSYILDRLEDDNEFLKCEGDETKLISRAVRKITMEYWNLGCLGFCINDLDVDVPRVYARRIDLSFGNPYRHLDWLPVSVISKINKTWSSKKDNRVVIKLIEERFNIYDYFGNLIRMPVLRKRANILREVIDAAKCRCFSAASLLLFAQTEGLLYDLAFKINGKVINGKIIEIFPDPTDDKKYFDKNKKVNETLSIVNLIFESLYRDFFDPGFLEYFSSDYYSERCKHAHGKILKPVNEWELKKAILFALTVLLIYGDYASKGKVPVGSKLFSLG